ncbi:MAG TPA: MarR family winged helix-turn-helix transcriptional regulator [Sulfuricella sp.]|nr:MarR family winged helix-turn-helix transcriptional regulator [Sulfuricella sp.]
MPAKPPKKPAKKHHAEPIDEPGLAPHHKLARETLKNFRVIFSTVRRHFQWIETQCGVSGAQLWAMARLQDSPGARVSDLAQALSIHQSTASNLVDKLVRKNFVCKERDATDQRIVHLYLSPQGIEAVSRAPRPFEGVLPNALENLPEDVLGTLNGCLREVISRMEQKDEEAALTPLSDIE